MNDLWCLCVKQLTSLDRFLSHDSNMYALRRVYRRGEGICRLVLSVDMETPLSPLSTPTIQHGDPISFPDSMRTASGRSHSKDAVAVGVEIGHSRLT